MKQKYVVTVNSLSDKELLRSELISNQLANPINRPTSLSNVYELTEAEASSLRSDSRVGSVTLAASEIPYIKPRPCFFDPSIKKPNIDADNSVKELQNNKDKYSTQALVNWWSGDLQASIAGLPKGKNVDVVIVDSAIQYNHPEFARNPDGTGGSRVQLLDWYQYSEEVTGFPRNDQYDYSYDWDDGHGTHVASTVAGITQGWAKEANIYFFSVFSSNHNLQYWSDYIRAFHRNKPINPATGNKNPTIINNSWGYSWPLYEYGYRISDITEIRFRGKIIKPPYNYSQLAKMGIVTTGGRLYYYPARDREKDTDVLELINDGIVVVAAAGNDYCKCDVPGGIDYDNYFKLVGGLQIDYHKGMSPAANAISVGAMGIGIPLSDSQFGTVNKEHKVDFSNSGPMVDIYAPGEYIAGALNPNSIFCQWYPCELDSRGGGLIAKISGTSMASPQVAGVLACHAESNRTINQTTALQFLNNTCKNNVLSDVTVENLANFYSLQGSANKQLFLPGATIIY